jgi:hypothetical protein
MSKPELLNRFAALSFSEKVRILEKLRGRSRAIVANRLRWRSPGSDAPKLDVNRCFLSAGRHTEE